MTAVRTRRRAGGTFSCLGCCGCERFYAAARARDERVAVNRVAVNRAFSNVWRIIVRLSAVFSSEAFQKPPFI